MKKISFLLILMVLLSFAEPFSLKVNAKTEVTILGAPTKMLAGQSEEYEYNNDTGLCYVDSKGNKHHFTSDAEVESSDPSIVEITQLYSQIDIDAESVGTATITISENGYYGSFTIKVVKYGLFIDHTFPKTMKIDKGSFTNLEQEYMVWANTKKNGFQTAAVFIEDNKLSASNKRISVAEESVAGKKAGKATLTLTVTDRSLKSECPDIYGKKFKCKVTVEEGPRADKTSIVSQAKRSYKGVYYQYARVDIKVATGLPVEYELWCSTKEKGKYKKVDSAKINDPTETVVSYKEGDIYSFDVDYLKPNKKYYFKVRGRYQDEYHSRKWSDFSKPVAYWTAAKPLADSKITFDKSTHKASWKAVKGAKGYTYTIKAVEFLGYNVFGQKVYYIAEQTKVCKKNTVSVPAELLGTTVIGVEDVRPITKHGKYYFVDGSEMSKKMSSFETDSKGEKRVAD